VGTTLNKLENQKTYPLQSSFDRVAPNPTRGVEGEYQMKTKVILTLCVVFVWGLVSNAKAQVIAGSPEDKAFQKIDAENNVDGKVTLLLDFEKQFPQSKAIREAYLQLLQIYQQKNDQPKVIEFGEKTLKADPSNIEALLAVTRAYSLDGKQASLDRAIQYANRAIDQLGKMKSQPAQQGKTDEQWKQYIDSNDQLAKTYLSYAQSLKR
jgi:tetratricopeptide (TPR) repeat protein